MSCPEPLPSLHLIDTCRINSLKQKLRAPPPSSRASESQGSYPSTVLGRTQSEITPSNVVGGRRSVTFRDPSRFQRESGAVGLSTGDNPAYPNTSNGAASSAARDDFSQVAARAASSPCLGSAASAAGGSGHQGRHDDDDDDDSNGMIVLGDAGAASAASLFGRSRSLASSFRVSALGPACPRILAYHIMYVL